MNIFTDGAKAMVGETRQWHQTVLIVIVLFITAHLKKEKNPVLLDEAIKCINLIKFQPLSKVFLIFCVIK